VKPPSDSENPFEISSTKDASLQNFSEHLQAEIPTKKNFFNSRTSMDGLEWRIAEGLLSTLFSLIHAYLLRGSPREALFFAEQAQSLAQSLNTPAMVSRALAKKGEVQLYQGQLEGSYADLIRAAELLQEIPGMDSVEIHRLRGDYSQRSSKHSDAHQLYEGAIDILEELGKAFSNLDAGSG
jgi:separase